MIGPRKTKIRRGASAIAAIGAALFAGSPRSHAYDPATTHAGLTERSVLASGLHRVLVRRLSRPLGIFEPVALRFDQVPLEEARSLEARLGALDPAGGYRPGADGLASALAWVLAGSVIAGTPPERGQHLFYDPSRGAGLSQGGGVGQIGHGLRQLVDTSGGFRALATGTNFNMTGRPSTEWLVAPENDVGLAAFYRELEAAVAAEEPGRRTTALARALLALGGTLAILQEAGDPAHVRNDFRGAYLGTSGTSPFDRGSAFERYVAETYGRMGVPTPAGPVSRPTVMTFITGADGQGLADRTQRRFFSDGSLPQDAVVDRESTPAEIMQEARATLPYAYPSLPRLELRPMGRKQYAYVVEPEPAGAAGKEKGEAGAARRRLFAYKRVPGWVRFFLDEAVYADTARALLPEIAGYGAGLIDHLFRGEVRLQIADGRVSAELAGTSGEPRRGELRLYAEDASGRRREVARGAAAGGQVSAAIPGGTRRIAAVFRGEDAAGEVVAVAERPAF